MRILWYLLTAFFGLIGVLAAARTIEINCRVMPLYDL